MTKTKTIESWSRRIERVIEFIDRNVGRDIDLDVVAQVAAFSPFHFHRIYRAVTGETLVETLRRRRLHFAANALLRSNFDLGRIAKRSGYGSIAAFTRAFRAYFGTSPADYRRKRGLSEASRTRRSNKGEEHMIDVRIETRKPFRVAAIRHIGPYQTLGATFEKLRNWAKARGLNLAGRRSIALYYDDPKAVAPSKLRSDACVEVPNDMRGGSGAEILSVAGGRYAITRHQGPYIELDQAYQRVFGDWFPGSGEEPGDAPCYDDYVNDPYTTPEPDLLTDICVPLKMKRAAPGRAARPRQTRKKPRRPS